MIRTVYILLGLFTLFYIGTHFQEWTILINPEFIYSTKLVLFLHKIPYVFIQLLFITLAVTFLLVIFTQRYVTLAFVISLSLIHITTKLCLDLMTLEEITNFFFFNVYHPIPLEWKIHHFQNELGEALNFKYSDMYTNKECLEYVKQTLNLDPFDLTTLKYMNALEIKKYAYYILHLQEDYVTSYINNTFKGISILIVFILIYQYCIEFF